jgi:TrmH family RNA methyltransferase
MSAEITSRKNELLQDFLRLSSNAAFRRKTNRFAVEGARLCADASSSGINILALFYTQEAQKKYVAYLEPVKKAAQKEYTISASAAQYISGTKTPQGIFCICAMPEEKLSAPPQPGKKHLLVLENMQDPANMGAVFRTAEALGIEEVFLGGTCCDVFSPKVLRASMGAVFRLPLCHCAEAPEIIKKLNGFGVATLAAVPDSTAVPVTKINFASSCAAVIGNEGNGLTEEAIKACSVRTTIPMLGRAESLNAAASAAILMWEMVRSSAGGENL